MTDLLQYILGTCYLISIQMSILGLIFDERDHQFWFIVYWIVCFITGLHIGIYLFS